MNEKYPILLLCIVLSFIGYGCNGQTKTVSDKPTNISIQNLPDWALGYFVRPEGANPILTPDASAVFDCPMTKKEVKWSESDIFNPAAVVKDEKVYILYRSEDNSAQGIGKRTSRIGLAESSDGIKVDSKRPTPVLYPKEDNMKELEWFGGCEDPRVAVTEDGTFVMMYTSWNRKTPRLCVATSKDLITWEKHGYAFEKAYEGRFKDIKSKSGSIVTKIENGNQVITKVDGKYLMYWGEKMINLATSDDLINWTPSIDENGELLGIVYPRVGFFDSNLTECGPPAILTNRGILLLYNGKNATDETRDKRFNAGTYSAGQLLFDLDVPSRVIARLDEPFFYPTEDFEKSGQYKDGTVFIEGLTYFQNKWFLYYGCADSQVGVAVYEPTSNE